MPNVNKKSRENFEEYRRLISDTDKITQALSEKFSDSLVCAAGCSSCCKIPRSVLPVEAKYIQLYNDLTPDTKQIVKQNTQKNGNCPFLVNDLCAIYSIRPIICRTHGLPLLYYFEEVNGYAITHCELNFSKKIASFGEGEYIDMETINGRLRLLNKELGFENERISFAAREFLKDL